MLACHKLLKVNKRGEEEGLSVSCELSSLRSFWRENVLSVIASFQVKHDLLLYMFMQLTLISLKFRRVDLL